MGDVMRPIPFGELVRRMAGEYRKEGSVFAIPAARFFRKENGRVLEIFGESCDTRVGPAAGPHTQLAQNILTAYLAGGRFFELKTVQKLDTLEVSKPCIDAEDECYNCEWSTELTLEKAYDEYLKAWVLLHVLEELFELRATPGRSFLFNMSVGYDLEGIRTPRMDAYLRKMLDSSEEPAFREYLAAVERLASDPSFLAGTDLEGRREALRGLSARISPRLSPSVTLSTMHGCPPAEIEAICRYLLTEKSAHTFVKLNPTLLGYERVREILDGLGFGYVALSRESFAKDLQHPDALAMLRRLRETAREAGRQFGVKLTNTLGSLNTKGWLPDREMYLSGRALFPLSINLAAELSREFRGELPISYSGGAAQWNVERILETGIRPVTVATDLLKPGGYLRLAELARLGEDAPGWDRTKIDVERLDSLAEESLGRLEGARKGRRPQGGASLPRKLPLLDCYAAPCSAACPIGQDVPEYVRLVGEGRYDEALQVVCTKNALPNITGYICDHACMSHCTRIDYDDPVEIRELKRIAAEKGARRLPADSAAHRTGARVAVVGAGPTGLAAAYFLARAGLRPTVLEKRASAGGVVRHVIPDFRIPPEAIERDVRFVEGHGVEVRFNEPAAFDLERLKEEGFRYVILAVGAEVGNPLGLSEGGDRVVRALEFLERLRSGPGEVRLGRRVAVVGGGNTAMDSARAALRVRGVERVTVVYRRTLDEMPAAREEYEACRREGVAFAFLTAPESFGADGTLVCRKMALGEPDASGRRSPMATEESESLAADTVLAAVGEHADPELLAAAGLTPDADPETGETVREGVFLVGDARSGPSTVVRCIADARRVTEAICRREFPDRPGWRRESYEGPEFDLTVRRRAVAARKGVLREARSTAAAGENGAFAAKEAERCLECNAVCEKCVDVCPNRANLAVAVGGRYQILHQDALCNECGNCARFCPYTVDGRPYRDKLTLFSLEEDFAESTNDGFLVQGPDVRLRREGQVHRLRLEGGRLSSARESELPKTGVLAGIREVIETVCREYPYLLGGVDR
ncbi:MAG: putative selenate reductase subunit YgfK [Deltaproteobacteria bacterium]|nr:putative selenate reductase subunit YgfK [Deltaproteobacteria bacterium]